MEISQRANEMMTLYFSTIKADALLQEAYEAVKKNLEGPPHAPGLVVVDAAGKYAGLFTLDDLMKELAGLYRRACGQSGKQGWGGAFGNRGEIMGLKKVAESMSAKRVAVKASDGFDKACALILEKQLNLLAVVDAGDKPVGIITRRKVLTEIAARMFS